MLMEMLDATVLNTALPQIAIGLHVNPLRLKEILTVYFLALGIFIPVSGWMADRFGEKKSMLFAIVLFTVSSLVCGLSQNLPTLVGFRFLQGVGGAFLMPVGRQIMVRVFLGVERIKAMATINIMTLLGLVLGPLVGGALTTYANWRWIFFLNGPVGIVGYYLILHYLPVIRAPEKIRFDFIGFILIGLALGSLLFLLDVLIDPAFSVYGKITLLAIAVGAIIIYVPYSKRNMSSIINLKLFSLGHFRLAALGSFFSRLTSSTHPFLIPLLLQAGYGYSAIHAGVYSVPVIMSTLCSMFFLEKVAKKFDNQKALLISTILVAIIFCSFAVQAFILLPTLLIIQQILMGFLLPIQVSMMNSQAYQNLEEPYVSQGTSVYSGIIQVSGSFGIALAALVMIGVIGPNDLQHHVPFIAFKVVFMVQGIYSLFALWLFLKMGSFPNEKVADS